MIRQGTLEDTAVGGEGVNAVFSGPSRRSRFVNFTIMRGMQWRMMVKVWLIVAFSLLVAGGVFYFYTDFRIDTSYRLFHVELRNFRDFLFPVLASGLLASMLLGGVAVLFFPQKIVGPLYRIERDIAEISRGNLRHTILLRQGDEGEDLAMAVNVMVGNLRGRIRAMENIALAIRDVSVSLREQGGVQGQQDIETLSRLLLEQIGDFDL
ncbi:MAG: hypothetical protein AB7E47_00735 [Desulfovibrionaceae bacterium]